MKNLLTVLIASLFSATVFAASHTAAPAAKSLSVADAAELAKANAKADAKLAKGIAKADETLEKAKVKAAADKNKAARKAQREKAKALTRASEADVRNASPM